MKILHVAWGFQGFRDGGLIEYAEDLMAVQIENGYDVYYFCTGRSSVLFNKPRLKRWKHKKGYEVFELWNPPVISGGTRGVSKPLLDVEEKITQDVLLDLVMQLLPDVVHFQEFVGVPTSVLSALRAVGIKTVFTIEDYFLLCPTLNLVKKDGSPCEVTGNRLGHECAKCCNTAPVNNFAYRLRSSIERLPSAHLQNGIFSCYRLLKRYFDKSTSSRPFVGSIEFYDQFVQRRKLNLGNLLMCDLAIAMSSKVSSVFQLHTKVPNMKVLNLTLKHFEHLTPRLTTIEPNLPVHFCLINVMGSTPLKGRDLMLDVFRALSDLNVHNVKFSILGNLDPAFRLELTKYPFVQYEGRYQVEGLNQLLDELNVHVGIVPSVWEEAYGYVGIEFLAKAIPVIGNQKGGIPDYVIPNETGWLNYSSSSKEMVDIILEILGDKEAIQRINRNLVENRNRYIKKMQDHFLEMDRLYTGLLENRI